MKLLILIILIINWNICLSMKNDYYVLLGVKTDASKSEIRKAFKKIALEKHPDKNKGDAAAHDTFLKINKAYEVLKDEELRKKYDRYGEDGLKDNHFSNNYQSWTYYNEQFGIYDDDPEVITLSKADFEQSVSNSEDIWFINFYSPHCSHCHTVAPIWRKLSEELSGVVRIGAVNCHDDWMLCNAEGIRGYPSLRIYPSAEDYYGEHSVENMMAYVFDRVQIDVTHLNTENINVVYESSMPWIISFCEEDHDCLSDTTLLKVSAMLEDLVNVGSVNCENEISICKQLSHSSGVYFYSAESVKNTQGSVIVNINAKELVSEVLDLLPIPLQVNDNIFQQIRRNISENKSNEWLFMFTDRDDHKNHELRKTEALLQNINIGHVNCLQAADLCQRFLINKYPTVLLYKKIGYEIHHGRMFAHDLANFARESLASNVRVMGPDDFLKISQSSDSYFIDFFAPWCPPCMKLLPEWRKAGKLIGGKLAHFGTVDCTIHHQLCVKLSIHSYPTSIFYNLSKAHIFSGYHTAEEIIEYAEDIKSPPVIHITPEFFNAEIKVKPIGKTWILKFYAPWCHPCNEMAPAYSKLAKKLKGEALVGEINCDEHRFFCQSVGITSYPTIRLFPHYTEGHESFVHYNGWRDFNSLYIWAVEYFPTVVKEFSEIDFYTILNSDEPWLVDFYTPWCSHCTTFAPHFKQLGKRLLNEKAIQTAKINCQEHYSLCRDVGIRSYPSLRFYEGRTQEGTSQPITGAALESQDTNYLFDMCSQLLEYHIASLNLGSSNSKGGDFNKKTEVPDEMLFVHDEF